MLHLRYVVMKGERDWTIVQAGHRHADFYPSRREALTAAIEFAERDGNAGFQVEVLVREDDGRFMAQWSSTRVLHSEETTPPLLTPYWH